MRDLQKIKDVIKKYIPDGKCGIYDCEGDPRDYKNKVYDNTFNVLDTSNFVEVVELYIRDQLMIMVNGYFVYKGKSPYFY
mgnify:CR=1 FL=1